jgi:crotonobetainyl-CoA:carnitine CoA-transferase CaiB-like acyl-CoA transferase
MPSTDSEGVVPSMKEDQPVPGATAHGGALDGLLVADFSRILAGPYATMLLADLGAEVVKVEGPGGDDTRSWLPPVRDGVSTYYLGVNRNKRSIALDFRDPDDLVVAQELARRADVVVENFKPGGLVRFGLDYDTVAAGNPRVVYASISGFGSGPEGSSLPGYDLIVQAISGLMSLTGEPEGKPLRAGISVFDVMAGLHATIGVLAALNARHVTGRGQHVEVNLLSSALSGLVNQSSAFVAGGVVPLRMGNSHPSLFPYEPLPCSDGDLIVTAGNNGQFRKLVEARSSRTTRGSAATRTAPPTARTCARCWSSGCAPGRRWSGSATSPPPGSPAGRSTPWTEAWPSPRSWAWIPSSRSVTARTPSRPSATRSPSPGRRRTTGCRPRRSTSTAPRSAAG